MTTPILVIMSTASASCPQTLLLIYFSYAQWYRIAATKIGLSDEATFAFFSAAQINDASIGDSERLRRFEKGQPLALKNSQVAPEERIPSEY
uniref:Transposase n=1 Tax=Steinernema glaseri TaxID=37863 RepID=A0A1I8A4V3_9BILA